MATITYTLTVYDQDRAPVDAATVKIFDNSGAVIVSSTTNSSGVKSSTVASSDAYPQNWRFVASKSGYFKASGYMIFTDATTSVQTVYLQEDPDFISVSASSSGVARADITAETATYQLDPSTAKTWDALQTNIPGTAASDDLGLVTGTFTTDAPKFKTGDVKASSTSRKLGIFFPVPPEYVAAGDLTLRLNAGMATTVSDSLATIDAQVVRVAAPTVDLCSTLAQTINSLTAANKDFTLTGTNVVPGDLLFVVITVAVTDVATVTAVVGELNSIKVLCSVQG